ncbi:hypothetical protein KY345_02515 [Candidatus Woesearchaeota archaeon]|nr:hypothetical protein [Candidatus Woesearchaeota archaeon]
MGKTMTIDQAVRKDPTLDNINPNDISTPERFDVQAFYRLATDYRAFRRRNGRENGLKISRVHGFRGVLDIWYYNSNDIQRGKMRKASGRLDRELGRLNNQKSNGYRAVKKEERGYRAHELVSSVPKDELILSKAFRKYADRLDAEYELQHPTSKSL